MSVAGPSAPARRWCTLADRAPPLDAWLAELGVDVVDGGGEPEDAAFSRDVVLDGARRLDLRVTVAWVDGLGLSAWAQYGAEGMEVPRRVMARMLRANFEYPFVKFGLTDDDRPLLISEIPPGSLDRNALGRTLTRLIVVADRLQDQAAPGDPPVPADRPSRNQALLARFGAEVEAAMPPWQPAPRLARRRGLLERLLGPRR